VSTLIWISGGSGGIGQALTEAVPWDDARIIDISRTGAPGADHVEEDLSDPATWPAVGESFRKELEGFDGDRVIFVHAAGLNEPIGFAGEVDDETYTANVIVNSAAPQVLGQLFLAAARDVAVDRYLIMLTSGAATSVYPGWASYGAGKAAIDQWVRNVGAEQSIRGGVQVMSVAPGSVDTGFQEQLRSTSEDDFPKRQKFLDLHEEGKLSDPSEVAKAIWSLPERGLENGSVIDLRELD
jgi:benzil reductase ((S)-benzoin forming)